MSSNSAPMGASIRRWIAAKIWPVSEPTGQQNQQPQRIVVPAYNPTRILGMARDMRTPRITCGPFYAWMRNHGQMLPPTRPFGPIAQPLAQAPIAVSNVQSDEWLNSAPIQQSAPLPETPLTTLVLPDWVTAALPERADISSQDTLHSMEEARAELLDVTEQDCTPDLSESAEDDSDATENVAALLKLRYCERKKEGA